MINRFILIIVFAMPLTSLATFQQPDILIMNDDTFSLWSNPLESNPEFIKLRKEFEEPPFCNTSCWRNYVAWWEIRDSNLYLIDLRSCCFPEDSITMKFKQMNPQLVSNSGIKADWVDRRLLISIGKMIKMFHYQGYNAVHQQEVFLSFSNGSLEKTDTLNNNRSLILTLGTHKKLMEEYIYSHIEWENIPLEKLSGELSIKFYFYWYRNGKEGVVAQEGNDAIRKELDEILPLISVKLEKSDEHLVYIWPIIINLDLDQIKARMN